MKDFILFMTLAFSTSLQAQTLLVPHPAVPFETYAAKCHTDGYICTQDYFKQKIFTDKSVAFEQFIESIDLYSENYRKSLFKKVHQLISEEQLSLDQVDLILKIIVKSETFEKNTSLTQIKNELIDLNNDLQNLIEDRTDFEFFILFKKALSKDQYNRIKYKIRFSLVTKITPYLTPGNALLNAAPLVAGFCETAKYNSVLKDKIHYTPLFESECALSNTLTTSKTNSSFKFKDYQTPLIYTAAGLLLISFFNQYKVDVTF